MTTMTATPAGLLTASQAATYLGISIHTLRQWVSQRRVPVVKLGRSTRFNPTDLAAYVAAHTRAAAHDGEARR
jgi:excisionase family DNA binding protein